MNTQNIVKSFVAASTITEFAVVTLNTAGKVAVATSATSDLIVGIAQRGASAGDVVDVLVHGTSRAIAGATLALTDTPRLAVTAAGAVKPGDTSADYPIARFLPNVNQLGASSGEQVLVFFHGPIVPNA